MTNQQAQARDARLREAVIEQFTEEAYKAFDQNFKFDEGAFPNHIDGLADCFSDTLMDAHRAIQLKGGE